MEFRALEKKYPAYNFYFAGKDELTITDNAAIENLFSKSTIDKIKDKKIEFLDFITYQKGGNSPTEIVKILDGQKTNLCIWLCENGTEEDFKNFESIFVMLNQIINS